MQIEIKKLVVIGLQQTFLQLVYEQIDELTKGGIRIRTVSLNELSEKPLMAGETVLYFSKGLRAIVEKMSPGPKRYIFARRENLVYNMRDLFALKPERRILVVNDVKTNTDEMTEDLQRLDLGHDFIPYYPAQPLPEKIDWVVTAGEKPLVPVELNGTPIIDIGLRFISLDTFFILFEKLEIPFQHASLARHYMRTMMLLSERWPGLGKERFRKPSWFGVRQNTSALFTFDSMISESPAMCDMCREGRRMAAMSEPVHVNGEVGTGKTRISQAIHNSSAVADGPFVSVNCAARTPETLERELFGWEDGEDVYESLFEIAETGTICIEEIGELPADLQARLLQAVTEKKIIRTNGNGVVDINVRLITTSSRQLDTIPASRFRSELLLVITQYVCRVPCLTERMADFDELVFDYLKNQLKKPKFKVSRETLDILKRHKWEGNVQELYNVLQHAVCMSKDELRKTDLPYYITKEITSRLPEPSGEIIENEFDVITRDLTAHGFLGESHEILSIYKKGKEQNKFYGRTTVQSMLEANGFKLSKQQLRLKLERMDKHGLLIVRPGRGGTTISDKGESYFQAILV